MTVAVGDWTTSSTTTGAFGAAGSAVGVTVALLLMLTGSVFDRNVYQYEQKSVNV